MHGLLLQSPLFITPWPETLAAVAGFTKTQPSRDYPDGINASAWQQFDHPGADSRIMLLQNSKLILTPVSATGHPQRISPGKDRRQRSVFQ